MRACLQMRVTLVILFPRIQPNRCVQQGILFQTDSNANGYELEVRRRLDVWELVEVTLSRGAHSALFFHAAAAGGLSRTFLSERRVPTLLRERPVWLRTGHVRRSAVAPQRYVGKTRRTPHAHTASALRWRRTCSVILAPDNCDTQGVDKHFTIGGEGQHAILLEHAGGQPSACFMSAVASPSVALAECQRHCR